MRILAPLLAVAALSACSSPDEVTLEYRSQLESRTRGIVLDNEGELGNAGMWGTTCDVDTAWGSTAADYDYEGEDEEVQDGDDDGTTVISLVVSPNSVNLTRPYSWPDMETFEVPGVVEGRLTDGGFVAVSQTDTCGVTWHNQGGGVVASVTLPGNDCINTQVAVDPVAGTVFIATDLGIRVVVQGEDATVVDAPENALIEWDASVDVLYVAEEGGSQVEGYNSDGTLRWSTELDGTVTALSDMGVQGAAAVSLATDKAGEFVVVDGITGEVRADLGTPSAATSLEVSGDGSVIAIVLPETVHFYNVLPVE